VKHIRHTCSNWFSLYSLGWVRQGADVVKKAKLAEELLLDDHNVWNDLDAFMLDEVFHSERCGT
jgi:hypothetical protein